MLHEYGWYHLNWLSTDDLDQWESVEWSWFSSSVESENTTDVDALSNKKRYVTGLYLSGHKLGLEGHARGYNHDSRRVMGKALEGIPYQLYTFRQLKKLFLDYNHISGNLIEFWKYFPLLQYANIQGNKFRGPISSSNEIMLHSQSGKVKSDRLNTSDEPLILIMDPHNENYELNKTAYEDSRINRLGFIARKGLSREKHHNFPFAPSDMYYCGKADATCMCGHCDNGGLCGSIDGCPCSACLELLGYQYGGMRNDMAVGFTPDSNTSEASKIQSTDSPQSTQCWQSNSSCPHRVEIHDKSDRSQSLGAHGLEIYCNDYGSYSPEEIEVYKRESSDSDWILVTTVKVPRSGGWTALCKDVPNVHEFKIHITRNHSGGCDCQVCGIRVLSLCIEKIPTR
jgi:hypothetical protein